MVAIASGHKSLFDFFMEFYKDFDEEFDKLERQIYYRGNINTTDLKGWNAIQLAVFHERHDMVCIVSTYKVNYTAIVNQAN